MAELKMMVKLKMVRTRNRVDFTCPHCGQLATIAEVHDMRDDVDGTFIITHDSSCRALDDGKTAQQYVRSLLRSTQTGRVVPGGRA